MPIEKNNYSIKFNQDDLIDYYHKNTQNDFVKKLLVLIILIISLVVYVMG